MCAQHQTQNIDIKEAADVFTVFRSGSQSWRDSMSAYSSAGARPLAHCKLASPWLGQAPTSVLPRLQPSMGI